MGKDEEVDDEGQAGEEELVGWMMGQGAPVGKTRSAADIADEIEYVLDREHISNNSLHRQAIRSSWLTKMGVDSRVFLQPIAED